MGSRWRESAWRESAVWVRGVGLRGYVGGRSREALIGAWRGGVGVSPMQNLDKVMLAIVIVIFAVSIWLLA